MPRQGADPSVPAIAARSGRRARSSCRATAICRPRPPRPCATGGSIPVISGRSTSTGHLFVRGRKKDLIIVGGYNVYPREIEEVLQEHPAILEAAVVGKPDSYRGEILLAFVVTRPGMDGATPEAALAQHCAERLARYKQPARYLQLPALPKTPINKVDRKALSTLAAERLA